MDLEKVLNLSQLRTNLTNLITTHHNSFTDCKPNYCTTSGELSQPSDPCLHQYVI